MHMKTIVSAGALALVLGLGGTAAFAQTSTAAMPTMIGGQTLTPADAERVSVYCEDLATQATQAEGSTNDDVDAASSGGAADTAAVGSVDMSLITLETCSEAGFIEPTATSNETTTSN